MKNFIDTSCDNSDGRLEDAKGPNGYLFLTELKCTCSVCKCDTSHRRVTADKIYLLTNNKIFEQKMKPSRVRKNRCVWNITYAHRDNNSFHLNFLNLLVCTSLVGRILSLKLSPNIGLLGRTKRLKATSVYSQGKKMYRLDHGLGS